MQELKDFELELAAGGAAPAGHVTVTVSVVWSGKALENKYKIDRLPVDCHDPEGKATSYLSEANGWKTKFYVKKGVDFECFINLRPYPFIKNWDYTWNPKTNQFVYYLS